MKKLLIAGLSFLTFLSVNAQVVDTLGIAEFRNGTTTLYTSPNGGFAFGNNGYEDLAKARSFQHQTPLLIHKVLLAFGEVIYGSADPNSAIKVNIYDNYGKGIVAGSGALQDSIAPDSILVSVTVPVSQLMTGGNYTEVDFSGFSLVSGSVFSVGIDLTQLSAGDTVGLQSTTDGDANGSNDAWELTSDGIWFQVAEASYSWGLDVQLAIFPIIEWNGPASVSELLKVGFAVFPNPCGDVLNLLNPGSEGEYQILISDMTGKSVQHARMKGKSTTVDMSTLKAGTYVITISGDQGNSSQSIIKK